MMARDWGDRPSNDESRAFSIRTSAPSAILPGSQYDSYEGGNGDPLEDRTRDDHHRARSAPINLVPGQEQRGAP